MPINVGGQTYYRTSEAARMAGISRSTLMRWLEAGVVNTVQRRDRRGWRLFADSDVKRLAEEAAKMK